jgi:hypothetical protein
MLRHPDGRQYGRQPAAGHQRGAGSAGGSVGTGGGPLFETVR